MISVQIDQLGIELLRKVAYEHNHARVRVKPTLITLSVGKIDIHFVRQRS